MRNAFTLIELLIVVAIIAILAAIAVPNFMEAQTRAKVSRAKNDMRAIAVGLEAYAVEWNRYPYPAKKLGCPITFVQYIAELTTPVAHLQTVELPDAFKAPWKAFDPDQPVPPSFIAGYSYFNWAGAWGAKAGGTGSPVGPFTCYVLVSVGPDLIPGGGTHWLPLWLREGNTDAISDGFNDLYDPTNGTKSKGDIARFGGDSGMPVGN
jgi:prepilin-type N-terminal cleavage/methylation domain-containing protein